MAYHIDEEHSELEFEVVEGNKLIIKIKGGSGTGGGGSDIYLIKVGDQSTPSDKNAFSALRTIAEINKRAIRKDAEDSTDFLVSFLKGIILGQYKNGESGAKIDEEGAGELASLILRGDLKSDNFLSGILGTGYELVKKNAAGHSYLEIDELFVRMRAYFTELEIKKLSYSGGNFIFSPAGIILSDVEETGTAYRCYFVNDDGETATENMFRTDDLVIAQTFNIKAGKYENVSNRRYWRAVTAIGDNYIDLSKTDCEANSDIPQKGDSVVTLGNKTDITRQNAIVISVYGEGSPSFTQHSGIKTFSLDGTEKIRISPNGNRFTGDFVLTNDQSIEDYVKDTVDTSVGDIQIGGRNYARNTGNEFKITSVEYDKYVYHDLGYDVLGLKSGDRIIVSFDYEAKDIVFEDDSLIYLQFKASYAFRVFLNLKENGTAHVVSEVILLDKNSSGTPIKETDNGSPYGRFDYITINPGGYLRVWNFKVEKGTVATDWSPAPEDTDGAIKDVSDDLEAYKTEVDVEFTKTNEAIAQSVTETKTYTDRKISTVNSTINTQVGRIDAAVTRIDNIDGEIIDMENRISVTEDAITATVKVDDMTKAGLELTSSGIVATADKFLIKQTNGQQVALFADGYLNADLINVNNLFASSIEAGSIKLGPFTIDEGGMLAGPASEGMTLSQDMILFTKDNGKRTGIGDVYDSNLEGVGGYFKIVLSSANCHTAGAGAVTVITSGGLPVSGIRQIGLSVYTSNGASDYALDLKGRIRIGGQKAFTGTWSITDPWSNIKSITFQDGLVVSCV